MKNNRALSLPVRRVHLNRPSGTIAEKIRDPSSVAVILRWPSWVALLRRVDVGDNVPPRWEGCCPQRPIIFLRDARTNNSSSFVGREGETDSAFFEYDHT